MGADYANLPDPLHLMPKRGPMTPLIFSKIKNHLLNDYSATEPGRFTYYLAQDQENFWKLISEKYPIPRGLHLHAVDKANVVWERLYAESSPKRFIELCQAVTDHIDFIQSLPKTERQAPMYYGDVMHDAFLREVWSAFEKHDRANLLKFEKSPYDSDPRLDRYVEYMGNDFGQKESEEFYVNVFRSDTVVAAVEVLSKTKQGKRWGISKITSKVKIPFFEIGAEAEKK